MNKMFCLEEELLMLFQKAGIKGLKCESMPKNNSFTLDSSDLKLIIDYANDNKIGYLFYSYSYANKDYYLIDNSKLKSDGDFSRLAYDDIALHNDNINSIDFEQPAVLDVFCVHNGIVINVRNYASWLDELTPAEDYIRTLKEKFENTLDDIKAKRNKEREKLLDELRTILLDTEEFSLCSNQSLRREFMRKFLLKKENEHFRNAFLDGNGYLNQYDLLNFADLVYSIYKKISKR